MNGVFNGVKRCKVSIVYQYKLKSNYKHHVFKSTFTFEMWIKLHTEEFFIQNHLLTQNFTRNIHLENISWDHKFMSKM